MLSSTISFLDLSVAAFLALLPAHCGADQFVEVTVRVESTWWPAQGGEEGKTFVSRCVLGTNIWMLDGEFLGNGAATLWYTGTNIIERSVVTKTVPPTEASSWTVATPSPIGTHISRILDSRSGPGRPDGVGVENVLWLAFCSGRYLKVASPPITLPVGQHTPLEYALDYKQSISVFDDELGLPSEVDVYSLSKALVCRYETEGSTTFRGWKLPNGFRFIQYRLTPKGTWTPYLSVVGRLSSVRSSGEPAIPVDVLKEISL